MDYITGKGFATIGFTGTSVDTRSISAYKAGLLCWKCEKHGSKKPVITVRHWAIQGRKIIKLTPRK